MAHGKKYRNAVEAMGDLTEVRSLSEAIKTIAEAKIVNFDETIEIHVNTGCNPKHADQIVRSTIILPEGTGKTASVAVFSDNEAKLEEAKQSGADITGGDLLVEEVIKGEINFDVALATPSFMKNLAKAARVLGPKGLMPSPKAGTVTDNIAQSVEELKKGKIEFRTDKQGIIHSILGKKSFGADKIEENAKALIKAIVDAKPSGIKGAYITKIAITSSMGPALLVEISETIDSL